METSIQWRDWWDRSQRWGSERHGRRTTRKRVVGDLRDQNKRTNT